MFRLVNLPLLLVALTPLLVASFAFNFNNFNNIFLLTGGGPTLSNSNVAGATDILISYTYKIAFAAGHHQADIGVPQAVGLERAEDLRDHLLRALGDLQQDDLGRIEEPLDVLAIERTGGFHGLYHVLHGVISPSDGVGPDDLKIAETTGSVFNVGLQMVQRVLVLRMAVMGELGDVATQFGAGIADRVEEGAVPGQSCRLTICRIGTS